MSGSGTDVGLAVGANIENDGQQAVRVEAGTRGVEDELAYGDAHAVHTEVAKAEDAFLPSAAAYPICHHNRLHVIDLPVLQDLLNAPLPSADTLPGPCAR